MDQTDLLKLLQELMALPAETEWFEFKEAKNNFHFDNLGEYFSALSNEASLKKQPAGWLIFGVTDKRQICGSTYRPNRANLDSLKKEVSQHLNNYLTFEEIYELSTPGGRVILFQIPPAMRGVPTSWKGHFYGRAAESLGPLSLLEIEQIRQQSEGEDWSAGICQAATLDDLDPLAITFARQEFKKKNNRLADESNTWDDLTFLNKAKVCFNGRITRAAIILLGKPESEHFLSPGTARITWILKDKDGIELDYQHFEPPLILAVEKVFTRIRNLTYRYLPDATLFPVELTQYDPWVMRETLHNCIAHQEYPQGGRIQVIEGPESVLFTNPGDFLPGSVEEVIRLDAPLDYYRNRLLVNAMVNFNMIDTIGSGVKRMFRKQRERNFPLPDYDLSETGRVKVRIIGKVLDERYTRMLMLRSELNLLDVIALDKVQKEKSLTENEFKSLKTKHLIEGRRPNLFISASVAAAIDMKDDYIKKRAFDKDHYKKMIVGYLEKFGEASRSELNKLLLNKLSDALNEEQKIQFVTNLLQDMRREGSVQSVGITRWAKWSLNKLSQKDKN